MKGHSHNTTQHNTRTNRANKIEETLIILKSTSKSTVPQLFFFKVCYQIRPFFFFFFYFSRVLFLEFWYRQILNVLRNQCTLWKPGFCFMGLVCFDLPFFLVWFDFERSNCILSGFFILCSFLACKILLLLLLWRGQEFELGFHFIWFVGI